MTRLVIIIIFFFVGYFIIKSVIKKFIQFSIHQNNEDTHRNKNEKRKEHHGWKIGSQEERYRKVLGVTDTDSPDTIKEKYRDLLAKYHPDKLQHLGEEFQEIAEQKTKTIIEAYEFFRKRHNF